MRRRRQLGVALYAGLIAAAAQGEQKTIKGRVVDAKGKPAADVVVGFGWTGPDKSELRQPMKIDQKGEFTGTIEFSGTPRALIALDEPRKRGGLIVLSADNIGDSHTIKIERLAAVRGGFDFSKLPKDGDSKVRVYVRAMPGSAELFDFTFDEPRFTMKLPVGKYELAFHREDAERLEKAISVDADEQVVDLKRLKLEPTKLAERYGKAPPDWIVSDARGIDRTTKVADLSGKWVLIEFWGYWCKPCTRESLPRLVKLSTEYHDLAEKFAILAFHDDRAKSFTELDGKLESIVRDDWNGKPLPLPILLDGTGKTIKDWGIRAFPTSILIDPSGRVVKAGRAAVVIDLFESKLKSLRE